MSEWQDRSIEKLEIFSEAHKKDTQKYSVGNPHPGYGKDPNILNCFGHTKYPMWVDGTNGRVIVKNAKEEAEVTGKEVELPKVADTDNGWS